MNTFDWKDLPSGRARFAGSIRGWDEAGHDTFAIDVDGVEVFGELKETFTIGSDDFGVAVVSFGYLDRLDVGLPITAEKDNITAIDTRSIDTIRQVIIELVQTGVSEGAPPFLKQYQGSKFTGKITFSPDWVSTPMFGLALDI